MDEILLFPHNQEAYEKIKEGFQTSNRVAVVQATGTGKSYLIMKCFSERLKEKKLFLTPSHAIIEQFITKAPWSQDSTVFMTYQALVNQSTNSLQKIQPSFIVLDEFHRCGAKVWGEGVRYLLEDFPEAKVLGTSATPIRYLDGSRDMSDELFDEHVVHTLSLQEAIVRGILPIPTYITALYTLDDEIEELNKKIQRSDLSKKEKSELLKKLQLIKHNWIGSKGVSGSLQRHLPPHANKFIVFCRNRHHLKKMLPVVCQWFVDAGITKPIQTYEVYHVHSNRLRNLDAFIYSTDHECIHLLFSIDMLNEGIHVEDVDGVILLRPTESPILFYQQIGRAIQAGDRNHPLIFDLVNNFASVRASDYMFSMRDAVDKVKDKGIPLDETLLETIQFHVIDETKDIIVLFTEIQSILSRHLLSWEERFEELRAFYEMHGHTYVPLQYPENKKLAQWVNRQRLKYKKGKLPKEYQLKLESLHFAWDALEQQWMDMFQTLLAFQNNNGHCNVPRDYPENKDLGIWVTVQRQRYKKGDLIKEKINKLESVGFVWNPQEQAWEDMFQTLIQFKLAHGHCDVPEGYPDNPKLAKWVQHQRTRKKNGKLSKGRIHRLDDEGFTWSMSDKWMVMFNQLRLFKEKHGHCNVPEGYEQNPTLANWVSYQRNRNRLGRLSDERIEKLNTLYFSFHPKGEDKK